MRILAFEFSGPERSVAALSVTGDGVVVAWHEAVESGGRSVKAFEMSEEVLRRTAMEREEVDVVAIGLGPGSYIGIRMAISIAQGWELAGRVRLAGISSVSVLAAGAHAEGLRGRMATVVDAQRGEFYLGEYALEDSGWREVSELRLASRSEVEACEAAGARLVGPEVTRWFPGGHRLHPRAVDLARLAFSQRTRPEGAALEPIYLRATSFVKAAGPRVGR
jgi:tRNA threonylcarbamoyladenosine biosynthesis protein TsaB